MNYRHIYHAGNFADLLKHAVVTELLRTMTGARPPLTVIDTHAGAGRYDLEGQEARRTGEAMAGIGRLMTAPDAPAVFNDLKAVVVSTNRQGGLRFYPGSPLVIQSGLRKKDVYIGCEARADDFAALSASMPRQSGLTALKGDGWTIAADRAPEWPTPLLLLIDPPFERGDDAEQAIRLNRTVLSRNPRAVIATWAPIKDLTGFDDLVMSLAESAAPAPLTVTEVRLRPLDNPMRMNGCAMLVVNAPSGFAERSREAADWLARTLGETGSSGRVERFVSFL
jgi:23S rRNA (adenine2030-N6)-methyltransferase